MLVRSAVVLFLSVIASVAFAKIDPKNVNEDTLRKMIATQASMNHSAVGYKQARVDIFGDLSLIPKGKQFVVVDVYCEAEILTPGHGYVPDQNVYNVEHTWPQSMFGGSESGKQKSDLHHLFPSDSALNSMRGNHPFGFVKTPRDNVPCPASRFGEDETGRLVFEPPPHHRGNVARALFYFAVRYNMKIDDRQEATLREWQKDDPVDQAEIDRNDEIEEMQGNRNPFIDQPELVDYLQDF